jgi:hypothetical protein
MSELRVGAPEQSRPWLLLIPATIGLAVAAILAFV